MRVNTARKLDKLMLDDRKETVEKNWLQKAAEEADLVISIFNVHDFLDYNLFLVGDISGVFVNNGILFLKHSLVVFLLFLVLTL